MVILLYAVPGIMEMEGGRTFLISATKLWNLLAAHIRFSASIRLCWLKWFSCFITFIYLFNNLFSINLYLFMFVLFFILFF